MLRPNDLVLRCYAERDQDGSWFTMCIDLNLYARADTLDEARQKLHSFISEYVHEAFEEDKDYFHDLIPRQAPLKFRMRFALIRLVCEFHRWLDGRRKEKFPDALPFKERLPLALASG